MALSGSSIRNEAIKNSQELLKETFADDPSFTSGIYFWQPSTHSYADPNELPIRLYGRSFSNANGVVVKFQTLIDNPIVVGDMLYDSNDDEYLLCTESFNVDGVHWKGKFSLCNWILKWQNKYGDILEYPCVDINSTQYNSGEQASAKMTIGSSQHMATLPYDENTIAIKSPQRFFLDRDTETPTSFIVTQNDNTSMFFDKKGLIKITMLECERNNDTDRPDLGICDYFEKDELKTNNDDKKKVVKSVISYKTTTIKSGGSKQKFVGTFVDKNGEEIDGVSTNWEIICDFADSLIVNEEGNSLIIGVDDDSLIDEEFKLVLSDESGNYKSSIIIQIGSLL
jgi:hypothetical protein